MTLDEAYAISNNGSNDPGKLWQAVDKLADEVARLKAYIATIKDICNNAQS